MSILEKEVKIQLNSCNHKFYKKLGYDIPINENGEVIINSTISIKTSDLRETDRTKITKKCDLCGKEEPKSFYAVMDRRKKNQGIDYCRTCKEIEKSNILRLKNLAYENTVEYYCLQNNEDEILKCFSEKNKFSLAELTVGSKEKVLWNCLIYGETHQHSQSIRDKIRRGTKCIYCSNQKVLIGFNDLWTTRPDVANLLFNKEDGYKYTYGSGAVVDFCCPDCNHIIEGKSINSISQFGLICPMCGDGFSYPEKFLRELLKQLNIKFEMQKKFIWSKSKIYDFYLPDQNMIIETHGLQHYDSTHFYKNAQYKGIKYQNENDKLKKDLALENQIATYIELDCRYSTMSHIKESVANSFLGELNNFNQINWDKCALKATRSIIKEIVDLWEKNNNATYIGKVVGLHVTSVIYYLKRAEEIGLCTYRTKK